MDVRVRIPLGHVSPLNLLQPRRSGVSTSEAERNHNCTLSIDQVEKIGISRSRYAACRLGGPAVAVTRWRRERMLPRTACIALASTGALGMLSLSQPLGALATGAAQTAYVANDNMGNVTPISLATNTPGAPITVGACPQGVAITPNGRTAYVVNDCPGTVTPITVATGVTGTPIGVGSGPSGIAITPDGTMAYVANNNSSDVTPITIATGVAGTPIPIGAGTGP